MRIPSHSGSVHPSQDGKRRSSGGSRKSGEQALAQHSAAPEGPPGSSPRNSRGSGGAAPRTSSHKSAPKIVSQASPPRVASNGSTPHTSSHGSSPRTGSCSSAQPEPPRQSCSCNGNDEEDNMDNATPPTGSGAYLSFEDSVRERGKNLCAPAKSPRQSVESKCGK